MTQTGQTLSAISDSAPAASKVDAVRRRLSRTAPFLVFVTTCLAFYVGWRLRDFELINPESGVGYFLGIAGAAFMLLLLIYPLRKRLRFLGPLGSVKNWFRLHMLFGIIGPVLILYHANFHLGSLNSTVALMSMLIVAVSGVIGRFIYVRIHYGLYGRRATLTDLADRLQHQEDEMATLMQISPAARTELIKYAESILAAPSSVAASAWHSVSSVFRTRRARGQIKRTIAKDAKSFGKRAGWTRQQERIARRQAAKDSKQFLAQVRQVSEYGFYERLFSLWHVLHLPLFYMLIVAALVHVFAVHFY